MPATRFAAENSAISVDATAVPMAPASCCTVFITAEPSAFIAAGSWFSGAFWLCQYKVCVPGARVALAMGGEPTSITVRGEHALIAVNTSNGDFVNPDGKLVVVNIATRAVVHEIALGGQPDSIAISKDGKYVAVVIENERDEDAGDAADDGLRDRHEGVLGDLVISVERAEEQAKDFGHSVKREMAFLTVHGMLHLLGYDHMEEEERLEMEQEQRFVMEKLGIPRE